MPALPAPHPDIDTPWKTEVRGLFAGVMAAVDALKAEIAGLRADSTQAGDRIVAELALQRVDAGTRHTALLDAINLHEDNAKARHEILGSLLAKILERLPAGEAHGTAYGAAVWSYSTDWQPMCDALGVTDLACRRTYYTPAQGIPSHYSEGGLSVDVAAGRGSQVSFKPPPGSVAAGLWDDELAGLLASKPDGLDWRIAIGNEDEAPDKGIDPAARVADYMHLLDIRDDVRPEVKVTWTGMGYSIDVERPIELFLPPALRARIDSVSINHYQVLGSQWRTWHQIMAPSVQLIRHEWGLPLVVWEWGYPEDDANPSRKPAIVAEHKAWCDENEVEVSCHYNVSRGVISKDPRYLQTSAPATTVAFQGLFATH